MSKITLYYYGFHYNYNNTYCTFRNSLPIHKFWLFTKIVKWVRTWHEWENVNRWISVCIVYHGIIYNYFFSFRWLVKLMLLKEKSLLFLMLQIPSFYLTQMKNDEHLNSQKWWNIEFFRNFTPLHIIQMLIIFHLSKIEESSLRHWKEQTFFLK